MNNPFESRWLAVLWVASIVVLLVGLFAFFAIAPTPEPLPYVSLPPANEPPHGITLPVKVTEVYDGDTITVQATITARVRLLDCWAPEVRGEDKQRGIKSKEHLAKLLEGKRITLHVPATDRLDGMFTFGRVLGRVYADGEDVSQVMVADGFATREKN